jgi:hypothetical protein
MAADGRALLEGEQLLGTEGFVVDLRSRLDEILQMCAGEKIAEVDEFAVGIVFDCGVSALFCDDIAKGVPFMMPHLFWRPRTFLPLTTRVRSEPTTAKGRSSWYC